MSGFSASNGQRKTDAHKTVIAGGMSGDSWLDDILDERDRYEEQRTDRNENFADATDDGPDAHVAQRELIGLVRHWLDGIPVKQRQVIMRRYGLDHGAPATLEEVAEEMGITRERVRQIQQEGLMRLKRAMTARGVGKDALL